MREVVFWIGVGSLLLSNALLVFSIARPELRFWPPPEAPSWRYQFVRVNGLLSPLVLAGDEEEGRRPQQGQDDQDLEEGEAVHCLLPTAPSRPQRPRGPK